MQPLSFLRHSDPILHWVFRTSWTRTCDFFKVIVFGGIIVFLTTLSLKRLDFRPEAVNARGDNGFLDPRFSFHLRISCHQKGMILFLGNRWKSSFSVTWMDWYGIQPKQEWNGNSNGVKWMLTLGGPPIGWGVSPLLEPGPAAQPGKCDNQGRNLAVNWMP